MADLRVTRLFVVVLMFHAAVLAAHLMRSGTRGLPDASVDTVQLLYIAPVTFPKVRSDAPSPTAGDRLGPPHRWRLPCPPRRQFPRRRALAASSVGQRRGCSLDARGASRTQRLRDSSASTRRQQVGLDSARGGQLVATRTAPRRREQFKTADGDWIVWIDANCYQVASPGPSITRLAVAYTFRERSVAAAGISAGTQIGSLKRVGPTPIAWRPIAASCAGWPVDWIESARLVGRGSAATPMLLSATPSLTVSAGTARSRAGLKETTRRPCPPTRVRESAPHSRRAEARHGLDNRAQGRRRLRI